LDEEDTIFFLERRTWQEVVADGNREYMDFNQE